MYAHVGGDFHCIHKNVVVPELAERAVSHQDPVPGAQQFNGLYWNSCGMEPRTINDFVSRLGELERWDAVLMQGGLHAATDIYKVIDRAHAFLVGACETNQRSTDVLLHRDWLERKHITPP